MIDTESECTYEPSLPELTHHREIEELNKKHAVVMLGGKCLILNEVIDPVFNRPDISLSSPNDFKTLYSNRFIETTTGDKRELGAYWLKHRDRREYKGVVFLPGEKTTTHFNLWRGFAVKPKKGSCNRYLDHIHENVAGGIEYINHYLIGWMADCVKNPRQRPGTSIVLRGGQGVGKGIACSEFGKIFSPHFVHVHNSRLLLGNFNSHLKDALVVFADEALWAGDRAHEGILKFLVTEETLPIEFKGKDVIFVKNHIRLMVSSNADWVVPAGLDERRFLVLDVGDDKKQDRSYFGAIVHEMENGGREALLDYLMNFDVSKVNLNCLPKTDALRETKTFSMTPVQRFWFECLRRGSLTRKEDEWPAWIECSTLHEEFICHAERVGLQKRASESELGIGLKKLLPGLRRTRRTVETTRPWGYELPDLDECREHFDRKMGCTNPWEDESDAWRCDT